MNAATPPQAPTAATRAICPLCNLPPISNCAFANCKREFAAVPAPTAAEQAQPVMVVPKSIYRAFHGKEQEAWLHGFRTAFERYATPVPEQAQPAGVTEDARDAARWRFIRDNSVQYFEPTRHWVWRDASKKMIAEGTAPSFQAAIDAARASTEGKHE